MRFYLLMSSLVLDLKDVLVLPHTPTVTHAKTLTNANRCTLVYTNKYTHRHTRAHIHTHTCTHVCKHKHKKNTHKSADVHKYIYSKLA